MKQILLFILIVLINERCSYVAKNVYGAKKPRIEEEQSILAWLKKNDLPASEVVSVDTIGFSFFFPAFSQSPLLFERTGKFRAAGFSNGKYCPDGVDVYLSKVNPKTEIFNTLDSFIISEYYTVPPEDAIKIGTPSKRELQEIKKNYIVNRDTIKLNFRNLNELFYTLQGNRRLTIEASDVDFILILPFAKFFGNKLQVKDLKKYYYSAVNNTNAKFKIVFLNLDKQEWWGKETNDRINITI